MTPEKFKDHRSRLEVTQKTLAEFLQLTTRQIRRYESGLHKIPGAVEHLMPRLKKRDFK